MTTFDFDATTWENLDVPDVDAGGQIRATLEGLAPGLLQHNPSAMGADDKTIPTPEVEAARGAYQWPDGQLFLPASAVFATLGNAASSLKYKNIPATRYGSRKILATLRMSTDGFGLIDADGNPITTYAVDVRRAVLGQGKSKTAVRRARPLIPEWSCVVTFGYDETVIGPAIVQIILDALIQGGRTVGLLDFRPERGGPFGRYRVVDFQYRGA